MRACVDCHMVTEADACPSCKSTNLSKEWTGYVVVLDAKRSEIAKKMNITAPGKYALKVR
ncbi:MAG TPA: transcription elongation factor subunit Spt4 [Candidatus Thermoplasmatota archaeon]|nr:transcription elongation factor subunit Spt4 [Candidatus Thermoplasmatota archaeon]